MPTVIRSAPTTGPQNLTLEADTLDLTVEVVPNLTRATLELSAAPEVIDALTCTSTHGHWDIRLPEAASARTTNGITLNYSNDATVIMVNNFAGRHVIENGTMTMSETITATVRLPQGSNLHAHATNGSVRTIGHLETIHFSGHNAELNIDSAQNATCHSHNGNITIRHATGNTNVTTFNGNVRMASTGTHTQISAHSGNINVDASTPDPSTSRPTTDRSTSPRMDTPARL
ncbi:hypothetical protein KGD82_27930 (plasmid) [Nocardiopsis eucommiae]|uniref:Adhesin domain-containing protein n=1 Tax=Nocardiopsis eucommiae TaxID=2831970 RepID=A0A975LDY2_9ACTN|nr:hypothetical protein KGD82_27930 [Nocardiopsis eucommiae]